MSENFKPSLERPDRTLGDEWADWDGDGGGSVIAGTGLFLGFSLAVFLLIDAALALLYYLTLPRLVQLSHWLPKLFLGHAVGWVVLTTLFWVQLMLTVTFGKNFFFSNRQVAIVFNIIFARVFRLGKLFRISRDKMGHSFIKVSNAIARATLPKTGEKRLMILLPRCLTKEILIGINKLKERYPLEIFTVSGGELARKKVKEYRPSAIIGVACERDLVSGIRDVASKIPVIGIPNRRPNGPCKDTLVDIDEITQAVEFYLTKPKARSS